MIHERQQATNNNDSLIRIGYLGLMLGVLITPLILAVLAVSLLKLLKVQNSFEITHFKRQAKLAAGFLVWVAVSIPFLDIGVGQLSIAGAMLWLLWKAFEGFDSNRSSESM